MRTIITCVMVCMLIAITLFACGGGGNSGGADTMTVIVTGPSGTTTTTYREGPYSTTSSGHSFLNPRLNAYITASNETSIEVLYWDGVSLGTTVALTMHVYGSTPGLYPVDPGFANSTIVYLSNNQTYDNLRSSTSGTIILSSVGNVGEKITGTFDAVVTLLTNASDTLRITGSFSITQDN